MRTRIVTKAVLIAGACAVAIALLPAMSQAQTKSKAKAAVPPNGCATSATLDHGQTCAAKCDQNQWSPVMWCVTGKLEATVFNSYEPSAL